MKRADERGGERKEMGSLLDPLGKAGHPTEKRIRENDRTERSANAPGGIAQSGKVERPRLFLAR